MAATTPRRTVSKPKLPNYRPRGDEIAPDDAWMWFRSLNMRPSTTPDYPERFPNTANVELERKAREEAALLETEGVTLPAGEGTAVPQQSSLYHQASWPIEGAVREMKTLEDLRRNNYQAQRLDFKAPEKALMTIPSYDVNDTNAIDIKLAVDGDKYEVTDDWFEKMSIDLFLRIYEFVSLTFGEERAFNWMFDNEGWHSLPEEFINYASHISRGDPLYSECKVMDSNGWRRMLKGKKERICLITGVLAKVLDARILNDYLFGGDQKQKDNLRDFDQLVIDADGYPRSLQRAESVRLMMKGRYTNLFWEEVDRVTMQIVSMLLPLINLQSQGSLEAKPPLTAIHQEVHKIVAEAGYMNIEIRKSSTVFRIEFPEPGEYWSLDQEHTDDAIYNASKAKAQAVDDESDANAQDTYSVNRARLDLQRDMHHYNNVELPNFRADRKRWDEVDLPKYNRDLKDWNEKPETVRAKKDFDDATTAYNTKLAEYYVARDQGLHLDLDIPVPPRAVRGKPFLRPRPERPAPPTLKPAPVRIRRIGKVQIVLFPNITRYYPNGSQPGEFEMGTREVNIIKAQVVYYAGDGSDAGEQMERLTLKEHVANVRPRYERPLYRRVLFWVVFLGLVLYGLSQTTSVLDGANAKMVGYFDYTVYQLPKMIPKVSWSRGKSVHVDEANTETFAEGTDTEPWIEVVTTVTSTSTLSGALTATTETLAEETDTEPWIETVPKVASTSTLTRTKTETETKTKTETETKTKTKTMTILRLLPHQP